MQAPSTTHVDTAHLLWVGLLPSHLTGAESGLPSTIRITSHTAGSALDVLRSGAAGFDLIAVDAATAGVDAVEFLVQCRGAGADLPVLLLVEPGQQGLGAAVAHLAVCDVVVRHAALAHQLPPAIAQVRARHDLLALFRGSRAAQDRLRTVLEYQPAVTGVVASDGTVAAMNQAGLTLLASAREQVVGAPFTSWLPPDQRYDAARFLRSVCQGESGTLDLDIQQRDGSVTRVRLKAAPLHSGDSVAALITLYERVGSDIGSGVLAEAESRAAALAAQVEALAQQQDGHDKLLREARAESQRLLAAQAEMQARHDALEATLAGERSRLTARAELAAAERERAEASLADARDRAMQLEARVAALEADAAALARVRPALEADRDVLQFVRDSLTRLANETAQRCDEALQSHVQALAPLEPVNTRPPHA